MGEVTKRSHHSGLYVRAARGLQFRDERVRRMLRKLRAATPWLEDTDVMPALGGVGKGAEADHSAAACPRRGRTIVTHSA